MSLLKLNHMKTSTAAVVRRKVKEEEARGRKSVAKSQSLNQISAFAAVIVMTLVTSRRRSSRLRFVLETVILKMIVRATNLVVNGAGNASVMTANATTHVAEAATEED